LRRVLKENGRPDEAQKVDSAWVSTIHGMCARILRDSALEIGTDPKFNICTDDTVASLQAQAINQVLSTAGGKYEPLFREYKVDSRGYDSFSVTGISGEMLRKRSLAINAAEHPMDLGPKPKTAVDILEEAIGILDETLCALKAEAKPTGATLLTIDFAEESLEAVKAGLQEVRKEPSEAERLRQAADIMARLEALRIAVAFDHYRKMGYQPRDMALLLRTLNRVEEYTDILREIGFDAVITGGTIFWKQYEPALMRHILRFMANPNNDEATYFVLSSPMLDLEPRDLAVLAQWKKSARGTVYRPSLYASLVSKETFDDLGDRAKRAIRLLESLLHDGSEKPSQAIRRFADESGYLARLSEEGMAGAQKAANFMKALRFVEEIEEDSSASRSTVAWRYSELMKSEPKHGPGVLSTEDPNAIQVMTIHASKGLEFPIVALGGFDSPAKADDKFMFEDFGDRDYVSLKGDKIAKRWKGCKPATDYVPAGIRINDVASVAKDLVPQQTNRLRYHLYLQAAILNEEQEEKRRLFYVGATRARDALVLAIQPPATEKGINADSIIRKDMAEMFPGSTFPTEDGLYDLNDGGKLDYRLIRVEDTRHAQDLYSAIYEEHFGEEPEQERELAASRLPQGHLNPSVDRALENADYHEFSYSTLPEYNGKDSTRIKNEMLTGKKSKRGPRSREEMDEIRSTALALGKALHAYMEYQVLTGKSLADRDAADDGKINQIAAQFELAPKEQKRLRKAIEAWNSSDLARRTQSFAHVDTEVPFYIRFADEAEGAEGHKPIYFTGEIDLLCYNDIDDDPHAFIVDYKTGGEQEDTETYLKSKHRLQAHCYAYAAFKRGFKSVDIEFACMEHEAENGDLLSVSYHFEEEDIELVKAVIYHTWKEQNDSKQSKNGRAASDAANAEKGQAQADPQAGCAPASAFEKQSDQCDGYNAPESNRIILALEADFEDAETEGVAEAIERIDRDELTPDEDQLLDDIADASERFEGSLASAEVTFEDAEGGASLAMLCWQDERVLLLSNEDLLGFEECFGDFDGIEGWTILRANEVTLEQVIEAVRGERR
ncbi:MAG: 3'-5' exonuclease, partial [Eggerthellaceae bacterium]